MIASLRALKKGDVAEHMFKASHKVNLVKASVVDYHPYTQAALAHHQAPLNREMETAHARTLYIV